MLMSHFEEPKLSDDEEPPTEQDKRKKLVIKTHSHTQCNQQFIFLIPIIMQGYIYI